MQREMRVRGGDRDGRGRPVIGILPKVTDGGISSLGVTYVSAVEAAGGMPVMLPYTLKSEILMQFASLCDGFLFTGGVDIHPARFGERISPACGEISPPRDDLELAAFRYIYASGKPILGICRGCQLLNVALGGTVVQDIPSEISGALQHARTRSGDPIPMHRISIPESTPLYALLGGSASVNSDHHQSVGRLGSGLLPMASTADGVIEAAYAPAHRFLWAIQWHPELGDAGASIFRAFLRAVRAST